MDESNTLKRPETLRASPLLFPDTTLNVFALFPVKFTSTFCVDGWLKNSKSINTFILRGKQNLQSKRCQRVFIQAPHRHPTVLWKRPLLLMHMSGMTAGLPQVDTPLSRCHSFYNTFYNISENSDGCPSGNLLGKGSGTGGLPSTPDNLP